MRKRLVNYNILLTTINNAANYNIILTISTTKYQILCKKSFYIISPVNYCKISNFPRLCVSNKVRGISVEEEKMGSHPKKQKKTRKTISILFVRKQQIVPFLENLCFLGLSN